MYITHLLLRCGYLPLFKKSKTTSKNYYNPIEPIQENSNEVDIDEIVEPLQTSQTNSPKQAPTKQLTKSFCL